MANGRTFDLGRRSSSLVSEAMIVLTPFLLFDQQLLKGKLWYASLFKLFRHGGWNHPAAIE